MLSTPASSVSGTLYTGAISGLASPGTTPPRFASRIQSKRTEPLRTWTGYAHVAGLEKIRGNDFNLNGNRYVNTAEPGKVMATPAEEILAQLLTEMGMPMSSMWAP